MRIQLIALCLTLVSCTSNALQLYDLNGQCGSDVRVFTTFLDSTPASTGTDEQGEFIAVDADFLREEPDGAVWFVFFHECGHRVAGHTLSYSPLNKEQVADCYAARRFVDTFGYNRLEEAILDLRKEQDHARNMRIFSCLR